MANKIEFIDSFAKYWKEKVGVDVLLKAGDQTDPIPAHKIILVCSFSLFKIFYNKKKNLLARFS